MPNAYYNVPKPVVYNDAVFFNRVFRLGVAVGLVTLWVAPIVIGRWVIRLLKVVTGDGLA